jgi:hypothetical protein
MICDEIKNQKRKEKKRNSETTEKAHAQDKVVLLSCRKPQLYFEYTSSTEDV